MRLVASIAFVLMISVPVLARRPVTEAERAKLVAAMAAQGCSGGEMEWDDRHFEVDEAVCSDGRRYDLEFDAEFRLINKELDD
jgi:hypothetical protein